MIIWYYKDNKTREKQKENKEFSIEILRGKGISKNMKEGGTDHRNSQFRFHYIMRQMETKEKESAR